MIINNMFQKRIDRDIKGVIKVGQGDKENVKQELEEYVVTRELQKHFADFFSSYKKGINGNTDKMGVWISGFFGSGKSHFLKILSYLLANRKVDNKRAFEYFEEDNKIKDPMVLADMKLALSVPTDVVLFNVDSKSEKTSKNSKEALVKVFLKVFNEMQGFCGMNPSIADLEKELMEIGKYDEFQQKFSENYGKLWNDSRHKFDFIQDSIVEVLEEMNFMSEAAARNWCEKAMEPYKITIEEFARRVKEYLKSKGKGHHIVFLVDEIGQYIGEDSDLMLDLQTITEDLGTACGGKAWIIVTSQQDIDSITETKENDFSKIQGRFDTRLSLSSANVDEVIKKRILEKNEIGAQTLRLLYEQKATIIKNLIVFNDGIEKKLYEDGTDFANVYPFVPYQFNLLGSVLTSIRTHGASGKHLSDGERSMIALFKESAMKYKDLQEGALITFNVFYDALHQFLDHSHKGVITKAYDNSYINPDKKEECFTVNVLKTLFMIKYVNEIKPNIDNITSLMIDNIDTDRIQMKKKVEDALNVLIKQTMVQKNGIEYMFLTDEEQEINREIDRQNVEMADVINKISVVIFEQILDGKKYRYPQFNGRYNFSYNQFVDDRPFKNNQTHDIGIRIITPSSEISGDETTIRMMSGQGKEVIVALPNDFTFLEETRTALKIEKFLKLDASNKVPKFAKIKAAKKEEASKRNEDASIYLVDALKNADIYVNGDKAQISSKDVAPRINEALGRVVSTVYHKLNYIDTAMNEANIREMLKKRNQQAITLENVTEANILGQNDVLSYINNSSSMHMKTSMKSILDRFMKAPYGFVEDDVEWIVARLFKKGVIGISVNGAAVTFNNKSEEEIVRYITKKEYVEKLLIERRQKATDKQKKSVREVSKELFGVSTVNEEDDAIMRSFQSYGDGLLTKLNQFEIICHNSLLPGKKVINTGKTLIRTVIQLQSPEEFFKYIDERCDDYLDFAEDYEPVKAFFEGEQKNIFEKSMNLMKIYDESKTFIVNKDIEAVVERIKGTLKMEIPYKEIPKLPELLDNFSNLYNELLNQMERPVVSAIDTAKERVFEELDKKSYKDEFYTRYFNKFKELYEKAEASNNIAKLQNITIEADALKVRLLNEISDKDNEIAKELAKIKVRETKGDYPVIPKPIVKKKKSISIKAVNMSTSWQIETEKDVEKYILELKERILKELEENTVVNIEF